MLHKAVYHDYFSLFIYLLVKLVLRINQACTMIGWKIHGYVEIYKKQSRKKVVVNTPARTDRSDGPYLQKAKTRGRSRIK